METPIGLGVGECVAVPEVGLVDTVSTRLARALEFVADGQAHIVLAKLGELGVVGQFLSPGLHREVGLAIGDDRLVRIAVLDDQVAGITGQADIWQFTPRA